MQSLFLYFVLFCFVFLVTVKLYFAVLTLVKFRLTILNFKDDFQSVLRVLESFFCLFLFVCLLFVFFWLKGPGKRGHIVANTLLPTQMFPRLLAHATFVADTKIMFLILFRNILCSQQMLPSLCMETKHSVCVPSVCAPKKHHEQQCIRNKVSSFARP